MGEIERERSQVVFTAILTTPSESRKKKKIFSLLADVKERLP